MRMFKFNGKAVGSVVVAVIVLMVFISSLTVVQSGTVGVVSRFGAVQPNVLQPGIHFVIPFITTVYKTNIQTLKVEALAVAASKDLQSITTNVAVNYHVTPQSAAKLYTEVGTAYETTIIVPMIQETMKAIIAQYSAEQLVTLRQDCSIKIKDELAAKIAVYGLLLDEFNIMNLECSSEFNAAIEAKQTAAQNTLKAQQELERVKVEAQQKVAQADAEALATRARADAEAYAIQVVQEQLAKQSDGYIEYLKANKWNGVLPMVQGSEASPVLDFRSSSVPTVTPAPTPTPTPGSTE